MFELLKTLAEEPAKRRKVIIFYIRLALSCIVASSLYSHFLGDYKLLDFDSKQFLTLTFDFFVSGKVLVVVFFYLLSDFILFELLSMVPPLVLNYFTFRKAKKPQFDHGIIGANLYFFKIIKKDETTKLVTIGKNFDEFYYMLLDYEGSETKDEVYKFTNSFLYEILTTYFVGTIVFYSFTTTNVPIFIDSIILISLLFLVFFYINICLFINLFERNSSQLITLLQTLKNEEIVNSSLTLFKVSFVNKQRIPGVSFSKSINGTEEQLLQYYGSEINLSREHVEDAVEKGLRHNLHKVLLLTNKKLTKNAEILAKEYDKTLLIVYFKDENDLRIKLEECFYDK